MLRASLCLVLSVSAVGAAAAQQITLPSGADTVKFAVIGDNGTGNRPEYEVGAMLAAAHRTFSFSDVLMLGDNLYGRQDAADFVTKFERPYEALLHEGVEFHAALGNHDNDTQRWYSPFHMGGQRYYTYTRRNVRFVVLDSNVLDPKQLAWLETTLKAAREDWIICYFHHPLYSDGDTHGSSLELRRALEPLFVKYGVDVAFSGHDHIYERVKPQHGITYFVCGASGQLRKGDVQKSALAAAAFDQDQSFMLVEVASDELLFQTISRTGQTVDSGEIRPRPKPQNATAAHTPRTAHPRRQ